MSFGCILCKLFQLTVQTFTVFIDAFRLISIPIFYCHVKHSVRKFRKTDVIESPLQDCAERCA